LTARILNTYITELLKWSEISWLLLISFLSHQLHSLVNVYLVVLVRQQMETLFTELKGYSSKLQQTYQEEVHIDP